MNNTFTPEELNSLRFYQGDISRYQIVSDETTKRYTSPFYTSKGAYHILNLLLYPGINNELARICHEKKKLPIHLINHLDELMYVYRNIFIAACRYQRIHEGGGTIHAFRKDRMQSMEMLEHQSTFAFTSCSLRDDTEGYFLKKDGILLLEFEIPDSVPYIIMNDVLGDNPYQYQEELLLMPFTMFRKEPLQFTEKELAYRDIHNKPPEKKYLLRPIQLADALFLQEVGKDTSADVRYDGIQNTDSQFIYNEDEIAHAVRFLSRLKDAAGLEGKAEEVLRSCRWKEAVRREVKRMMGSICAEFDMGEQ